jgi:hypothetical protein
MKRVHVVLAAACAVALGAAVFNTSSVEAQGNSDVRRGYEISPVPLNTAGLNPALVGLGSYIVNAQGACNDCHTAPAFEEGGDPYLGQPERINVAGYLGGGGVFGPFTSRNLTPRANGLPAGLTEAQFIEVMRRGTDFKNQHPQFGPLLQVMPWPVYANMSDRELSAIYEYLRAIPCVGSATRCGN